MKNLKKGLSLLLALILLLGLVPVLAVEAQAATSVNLVHNGDFEGADIIEQTVTLEKYGDNRRGNTSYWQATGGVDDSACIRINPSRDFSGINKNAGVFIVDEIAAKLHKRTDKYHVLDIKQGETYRVSVDVWRPEGFKPAVRIGVENNGGLDFTAVTGVNYTATTGLGEGKWETITWEGKAKRDAQYLGLHIIVRENNENDVSAEGEYVLIDNVSFVCTTNPDQQPLWIDSGNLVVGGDFESEAMTKYNFTYHAYLPAGPVNWHPEGSRDGTAYASVAITAGKNGASAALAKFNVSNKDGGATEHYTMNKGDTYIASCDVRVTDGAPIANVSLEFYNYKYTGHEGIASSGNHIAKLGEWYHIYWIFKYDGDNTAPHFILTAYTNSGENNGCELQFDNMSLRCLSNESVKAPEAIVNGTRNYDVETALTDLTAGQKITLLKDVAMTGYLDVPSGATLDLCGNTLTAEHILSFGDVIDTTQAGGGLKISNNRDEAIVHLQTNNSALPMYDTANGCYRFADYELQSKVVSETDTVIKYAVRLDMADKAYQYLTDEANKDLLFIRMEIVKDEEVTDRIDHFFRAATLAEYANAEATESNAKAIFLTVSGLDKLNGAELNATACVLSPTGVKSVDNWTAQ